MFKITGHKPIDRVRVLVQDTQKAKELNQAKGVINNYLKDKHFTVEFTTSPFLGNEFVCVKTISDSKKAFGLAAVKKDGDTPFLRRIYQTIENVAKNKNIKMVRKHQVGSISDDSQRYSFKELVAKGIDAAIANNVNFLKFDMQFDSKGEKIVYIKLHGVQFSFHGVPFTPKMRFARTAEKQQYEAQVWDHTPLQNGASELFNYAIEQDNLTRIYYDGSGANPRDLLTRERRKIRKQEAIKNAVVSTANNNELMRLEDAFEGGNASEIKTVSVSEVQTETKQTTKNNDNINEFAN